MSKIQGVLIIASVTIFLLLKVYVSHYIYLTSRDIQKVRTKIDALKEEQSILKIKIEKLKYKNEISDPLFNYSSSTETENQDTQDDNGNNEVTIENTKSNNDNKKRLFDNLEVDILEGY